MHNSGSGSPRPRGLVRGTLGMILALGAPPLLFYLLRFFGASVYLALVVVAVSTGLPALYSLLRAGSHRHPITTYFSLASVAAVALAFIPGSPQFLLARDALITAGTGLWFISTLRASRPIVYTLTKPLLEGRLRWPGGWEKHWESAPRFRRMWRVSTILWGSGFLLDALLRVALAYSLKPDAVPAATTAMYLGTTAVLMVLSNAYYIASGMLNPRSRLFAPSPGEVC
ncbi:MAG: VC0807 family protein [Micrococcaceae bacterium]|nr:VC0807 family protein [Micrococcaceae bacterium]